MKTSTSNNIESKNRVNNSLYVTVSDGVVQDLFTSREKAIGDMRRHVQNTLVGCCGGVVAEEGEACIVVDFPKKGRTEVCMVVPFDPTNREHRDCYKAQRGIYKLPELATLEQPSEISDFAETLADDLKEGDRVLVKELGVLATVVDTSFCYTVEYDSPIDRNGHTYTRDTYGRTGLTKNFDPEGREIVGNAEYYRESLLAEWWGNDRTPRTVFGCEIYKPTPRRQSWLVVADIFSRPQEMTLRQVCDYLADRYRESITLPEPPKEVTLESVGEITAEPTLYERHNITADERRKRAEGSA